MEKTESIVYILLIGACLFFAVFVYLNNPKSPLNRYFSLCTGAMIGWVLTLMIFYHSTQAWTLFIGRLNFVFTELIAYFGFYFGYWFPKRTFKIPKYIHFLFLVWIIFFAWFTMATDYIDRNEVIVGNEIETQFGVYFSV